MSSRIQSPVVSEKAQMSSMGFGRSGFSYTTIPLLVSHESPFSPSPSARESPLALQVLLLNVRR